MQLNVTGTPAGRRRTALRKDPTLKAIVALKSPEEIDAWLAANVKTAADYPKILQALIRAINHLLLNEGK